MSARKVGQGPGDPLEPPEQVTQRCGVGIEGCAAVVGERSRSSRGCPVTCFLDVEISGVFEFAKVCDQVPWGEPDHVLEPGEGERVAVGQGCEYRDDAQPRRDVDQRVELRSTHSCTLTRGAARPGRRRSRYR